MQIATSSYRVIRHGSWVLVLFGVAAGGIAAGRWLVPAENGVSSASLDVSGISALSGSVAPDSTVGHVIGVTFEQVKQPDANLGGTAALAAPDSPADGHVLGLRFGQAAHAAVAPDSAAEGHVIGIRFQ